MIVGKCRAGVPRQPWEEESTHWGKKCREEVQERQKHKRNKTASKNKPKQYSPPQGMPTGIGVPG